jgi:hypothetical protein
LRALPLTHFTKSLQNWHFAIYFVGLSRKIEPTKKKRKEMAIVLQGESKWI